MQVRLHQNYILCKDEPNHGKKEIDKQFELL
jgi:hypothetical protein